ncbi:methyltransferase-like protein 27 [Mytilus edulis]|uniref:methyltransferase-like protein 27 n=1 Tax=Mytilus edulis TaxID=6550 RepID=UPI0039F0DE23
MLLLNWFKPDFGHCLYVNSLSTQLTSHAVPRLTMNDKEYNNHETHLFNTQLSSDQVADYYDRWAENGRYDEEIKNTLKAPEITAKTTITLYDQSVRPSIEILDIGAGTGLVAEMLRKSGFQKIDALDPSKGMLEKAKEKNLYRNYVCELLTKETFKNANGLYDCIVCSGSFCPGHIPAEALQEFIRLTKKGGRVVIAMRDEWEAPGYSDSIKTRMRQLIDDGKWVKTHEELYNHYFDKAGVVYVFQVA